jgi:hypothetical protein
MIRAEDRWVALARVLGATDTTRSALVLGVLSRPQLFGTILADAQLARLVDDLELPLSTRTAKAWLELAGLADAADDGLAVRTSLALAVLDELPFEHRPDSIDLHDLSAWMDAAASPARPQGQLNAAILLDAVGRAAGWVKEITEVAVQSGLPGLPVFWWARDEEGGARPEALDVGSIATVDGLSVVLDAAELGLAGPAEAGAAQRLVRMLLEMQRTSPGWHDGVAVTPQWDDDFVGSMLRGDVERGPCPTLDSTACLGIAIARALEKGMVGGLDDECADAVRLAAALVLRWQETDGSWAVHRYDPEGRTYEMPARTLSMLYAVEALASAHRVVGLEVGSAAASATAFLAASAVAPAGDELYWALDFADRGGELERVGATALLIPALQSLKELGCDTESLLCAAQTFVRRHWNPDWDQPLLITFRVPTWDGPAKNVFTWELPLHPIVVSALLRCDETCCLELAEHQQIAATIERSLAENHPDGFWMDILKAAEGNIQGNTGNTGFFQRSIVDYVLNQRRWYARTT